MDINYPVSCPLMDDELIDEEICFDIHMVVDAGAPERTAPSKAVNTERFREICRNCRYHRDD